MRTRDAFPAEASYLSALAIRSKATWGYSAEFMSACLHELTILPESIDSDDAHYVVALVDEAVVGYYSLEAMLGGEIDLSGLFVDPDHIGTGIGKALIEKAKCHAASLGAVKINIQSDPHAEHFYRAAGGLITGRQESGSISGRYLPMLQINLSDHAS